MGNIWKKEEKQKNMHSNIYGEQKNVWSDMYTISSSVAEPNRQPYYAEWSIHADNGIMYNIIR